MADLDDNPVRYMVLACGSNYPLVAQQGYELVQVSAEESVNGFDMQALRKDFRVEYAEGVFKLSHEVWSEPPHFAEAYHEEASGKLFLSASTDKGYRELSTILNTHGMNVPAEPEIRLHITMNTVIEKALKRKLEINPFSRLFETPRAPEREAQLSKLNQLLALALPFINSGQQPDVAALAKEAGVDYEQAKALLEQALGRINELRK